MAGHCRTTSPPPLSHQQQEEPGTPAVARIGAAPVSPAERLRTTWHARLTAAPGPREKFNTAVDYVRAAVAAASRAGVDDLDRDLTEAATDLTALGDALTVGLHWQQQANRQRGRR